MSPWHILSIFLLVAQSLASFVTAMSTQGRPVTDTLNGVAIEYLSTRTLLFVMAQLLILLMFATLPRAARSLS